MLLRRSLILLVFALEIFSVIWAVVGMAGSFGGSAVVEGSDVGAAVFPQEGRFPVPFDLVDTDGFSVVQGAPSLTGTLPGWKLMQGTTGGPLDFSHQAITTANGVFFAGVLFELLGFLAFLVTTIANVVSSKKCWILSSMCFALVLIMFVANIIAIAVLSSFLNGPIDWEQVPLIDYQGLEDFYGPFERGLRLERTLVDPESAGLQVLTGPTVPPGLLIQVKSFSGYYDACKPANDPSSSLPSSAANCGGLLLPSVLAGCTRVLPVPSSVQSCCVLRCQGSVMVRGIDARVGYSILSDFGTFTVPLTVLSVICYVIPLYFDF